MLAYWIVLPTCSGAATNYVTSTEDSGPGSLRQAILEVNAAGGGKILFSNITSSIVVTSVLPSLMAEATIVGPGTNFITFFAPPFFQIETQAVVKVLRMNLPSLTLSNSGSVLIGGSRIGSCDFRNNGMLEVRRCAPSSGAATMNLTGTGRAAVSGMRFRGVDLDSGELALTDCVVSGRTVRGIDAVGWCVEDPLDTFYGLRCWISPYATSAKGGGVYVRTGMLSMTACVISNNHVRGGNGTGEGPGGIRTLSPPGSGLGGGLYLESGILRMTNCAVANNSGIGGEGGFASRHDSVGGGYGVGGIAISAGSAVLVNCTITRNTGTGGDGDGIAGGGASGGIYASWRGANLQLINCTVTDNIATAGVAFPVDFPRYPGYPGFGAGGLQVDSRAHVEMINSILAKNLGSISPRSLPAVMVPNDGIGDIKSLGHNLIGTTNPLVAWSYTNYLTGFTNSDLINTNPLLGPLQDNGGPVFTHALLAGSPAIDAGTNAGLAFDARGRTRTIDDPRVPNASSGDGTDIGALEVDPVLRVTEVRRTGDEVILRFTSVSDKFYGVQFKSTVDAATWTTVPGRVQGTGGDAAYKGLASSAQRFYRVFESEP